MYAAVLCTNISFSLAFTKWVNNKLDLKNIPNIVHLNEDLANGVRLIQLLVSAIYTTHRQFFFY